MKKKKKNGITSSYLLKRSSKVSINQLLNYDKISLFYIICFFTFLQSSVSFAQIEEFETINSDDVERLKQEPCLTTFKALEQYRELDAEGKIELKNRTIQFDREVNDFIIASRLNKKKNNNAPSELVVPLDPNTDADYVTVPEYTIPVVFHVVHDGDEDYILTIEQVQRALKRVNENFNGLSKDRISIQDQFKDDEANVGIRFVLAQKDPDGNPTIGITYGVDSRTYGTSQEESRRLKRDVKWPTDEYLNIWVVNKQSSWTYLDGDRPNGGSAYAYRPAHDNGQIPRGVNTGVTTSYWVLGDIVETNPTRHQFKSTLTHEIGHWLGLNHAWGSGSAGLSENCNKDDGIADTPNTIGPQSISEELRNCSYTFSTCGTETNVHDYMNYGPCRSMYTNGHKEVMIGALNSSVAGRNNVVSGENLQKVLYTENPTTPRLIVSSELGNGLNLFEEELDFNLGTIRNKVNLYLKDVSFNEALIGEKLIEDTHFTIGSLQEGFQAEITIVTANSAVFEIKGQAEKHDRNRSEKEVEVNFGDAVFDNVLAENVDNATGIIFEVRFGDQRARFDTYEKLVDRVNPLYNNSQGLEFGFYERLSTTRGQGNSNYSFKFSNDELYIRLNTDSGASGVVLNNDGNESGVDQVAILERGTVLDQNANWSVKNSDLDPEKGWKKIISQNQVDIDDYLNKDLYFGMYFSDKGKKFYQWICFTLFKTEYGKLAFKLIDHAYAALPDAAITAAEPFHLDEKDTWIVRDYYFINELVGNEGALDTKSMELLIRGNNNIKNGLVSSDYLIRGLPEGISVSSAETLDNGKKVRFNLSGKYTKDDFFSKYAYVYLKKNAFVNQDNIGKDSRLLDGQEFVFNNKKAVNFLHNDVRRILDKDRNYFRIRSEVRFGYEVDYTKPVPEITIFMDGNNSGSTVKYDCKFIADESGSKHAKLLGKDVLIGDAAGLVFPGESEHKLGEKVILYNKDYTDIAGKEGYIGIQYASGRFRYYMWARIKMAENGEWMEIIDYAVNLLSDQPIVTGSTGPNRAEYCEASNSSGKFHITDVQFGTINNSDTEHAAYSDYTTLSTELIPGDQQALTINLSEDLSGNALGVWIDWNNDFDFGDIGEKVYSKFGTGPYTTMVTVPRSVTLGTQLRMRVRLGYGSENYITPCGPNGDPQSIGEVEDYTVTIGKTELGINDVIANKDERPMFYPVPFRNKFVVNLSGLGVQSTIAIDMYDMQGKLLLHERYNENPNEVELGSESMEVGTYLIRVTSGDISTTSIIVKE